MLIRLREGGFDASSLLPDHHRTATVARAVAAVCLLVGINSGAFNAVFLPSGCGFIDICPKMAAVHTLPSLQFRNLTYMIGFQYLYLKHIVYACFPHLYPKVPWRPDSLEYPNMNVSGVGTTSEVLPRLPVLAACLIAINIAMLLHITLLLVQQQTDAYGSILGGDAYHQLPIILNPSSALWLMQTLSKALSIGDRSGEVYDCFASSYGILVMAY